MALFREYDVVVRLDKPLCDVKFIQVDDRVRCVPSQGQLQALKLTNVLTVGILNSWKNGFITQWPNWHSIVQ